MTTIAFPGTYYRLLKSGSFLIGQTQPNEGEESGLCQEQGENDMGRLRLVANGYELESAFNGKEKQ